MKSLTNIHNCKFVVINSRVKFRTQRRCFKILIRSNLVEQNDNTFSLMRFSFEYSQNIRSRNQIIREVLRIRWFSNIFFHHFRYRRSSELVENAKIQIEIVKICITILRFVCVDRKYFDLNIFNESLLHREINEIKRMYEKSEKRERKTISRDILLDILQSFDTRIRKSAILHVAFCLAFADFLRIDEFTWSNADRTPEFSKRCVTRSSVAFLSQGSLDIYCGHRRCRLCGGLITRPLWAFSGSRVCSPISSRSVKACLAKYLGQVWNKGRLKLMPQGSVIPSNKYIRQAWRVLSHIYRRIAKQWETTDLREWTPTVMSQRWKIMRKSMGWGRQRIDRLLERHVHCCACISWPGSVSGVTRIHDIIHVVVLEMSCPAVVGILRFGIVIGRKESAEEVVINGSWISAGNRVIAMCDSIRV